MFYFLAVFLSLFISFNSQASTRVWEQANNPANYVVLEKLKESKAEELILNHPYTFDPKKLTDMFLSLRYNKALVFRKDIQDQQIFFDIDTLEKKFIPHIVEAFQKATPNQVVVFSIVQKDPYFIIRNDRLNVIRTFLAQDGLHVIFLKTDAKLLGDYQAHTKGQMMIDSAHGLGVTLEAQEGQKLAFTNTNEIILDPNYDFAALVDKKTSEQEAREAEKKNRKRNEARSVTPQTPAAPVVAAPQTTSTSSTPKSSTERLKELKELKDQGLISPQDYEVKKKEILKGL
jgi:hypothetical protein